MTLGLISCFFFSLLFNFVFESLSSHDLLVLSLVLRQLNCLAKFLEGDCRYFFVVFGNNSFELRG